MRIPLGISDFRKLRQGGFDYVDKSLFIKEIIDESSQVILLPRPRRFGKTLNLSMLRYYLERPPGDAAEPTDPANPTEDRWALFADLAIAQAGEHYRASFQQYPTLHLTFKDIKDPSWEGCLANTAKLLASLYEEHRSVRDSLIPARIADFDAILTGRASQTQMEHSLFDLSRYLSQHHRKSVLVLLDEYDTPLHTAHLQGYYDKALPFFRTLLSAVLKDNVFLHKGILTGVLRVAKDNIFTGLNNIDVFSLLSRFYATAFGFTQAEVEALLHKAQMDDRLAEVQRWYNGYLFGGQVIYNPWSVLSFVKHQPAQPESYWANTSSNDLIQTLLQEPGTTYQPDWEALLRGESIERPIVENVALRDLKDQPDLLWSVLVFSGYLKVLGRRLVQRTHLAEMAIPNEEVRAIYENQFTGWLNQRLGGDGQRQAFLRALLKGDTEQVEKHLASWLMQASYHDTAQLAQPERFYHGLVLGLLVSLSPDYEVRSNSEAGYGRCDILIAPRAAGQPGVVLELKVANAHKRETLQSALKVAKRQLQDKAYDIPLRERGATPIHQMAVAWLGKDVLVASVEPPQQKRRSNKK